MPVNIKFLYYRKPGCAWHCGEHIAAIVEDAAEVKSDCESEAPKTMFINFYGKGAGAEFKSLNDIYTLANVPEIEGYDTPKGHYLSCKDVNFADLYEAFSKMENYSLWNNCADQINDLIRRCYGNIGDESYFYTTIRCVLSFIGCCGGGFSCCPGPICVATPHETMKRVERLATLGYGILSDASPKSFKKELGVEEEEKKPRIRPF